MRVLLAIVFSMGCSREAPSAKPVTEGVEKPKLVAPPPSALPVVSAKAAKDSCIDVDAEAVVKIELDGIVTSGTHSHPNGTVFTFYLLRLPEPRCARGIEDPTVQELQLVAPEAIDLKLFVGKKVHAVGTPMVGMTAWYVRPAALDIDSIKAR